MAGRSCFLLILASMLWWAPSSVLAQNTAPGDVYVVPFSHLDLLWGGTLEECLARGVDIISKAVHVSQGHPEFRFLLEHNDFVANYAEVHPPGSPEFETLKRLVKEGRIEIAPLWSGMYQTRPGGEAQARNLLYGKRYAREVFGVDPQVAHLGDLPGFTPQFPQLLAESHTAYTVMTRMGPSDKSLFRWKSPDGSRALVWNSLKGYGWGARVLSGSRSFGERSNELRKDLEEVRATTSGPIFMTWGIDLWAPSSDWIDIMNAINRDFKEAHFRFASPTEFFQRVADTPGLADLSGEIPDSWFNQVIGLPHVWPLHVPALNTLVNAEKFAAINYAQGYANYPQAQFEFLWKKLLESMDHNQDGQGGLLADQRKIEYARLALYEGGEILRNMLRNIAERVRVPIARSTPIVVFNPLGWKRDDVVRTHVTLWGAVAPADIADYRKGVRLVDESGNAVPFHVEDYTENISRALDVAFIAHDVPPMGYRTYFLVPTDQPQELPNASQIRLDHENDFVDPRRPMGEDAMENEFYRLSADKVTGRVNVFDKALNRQVWKDMEIVGIEDHGGHYIRVEPVTGRVLPTRIKGIEIEENNSVRTVMRITGDIAGNPVTQRWILYRGLKRVDLENTIDWKEAQFLKIEQRFPFNHPDAEFHYGIPFGENSTDNIMPNAASHSADEATTETWRPARLIQDWISAGNSDWGVTLAADNQLVTVEKGALRAGMLKGTRFSSVKIVRGNEPSSTRYPVPGEYVYRYSLSSGAGDWRAAKSYQRGMNFNNDLQALSVVDTASPKSLPPANSFCSLEGDNLVISALKKSDFDSSIMLRAFEIEGKPGATAVEFLGQKRSFRGVNLLEEDAGAAVQSTLSLRPYQIRTIKLEFQK